VITGAQTAPEPDNATGARMKAQDEALDRHVRDISERRAEVRAAGYRDSAHEIHVDLPAERHDEVGQGSARSSDEVGAAVQRISQQGRGGDGRGDPGGLATGGGELFGAARIFDHRDLGAQPR